MWYTHRYIYCEYITIGKGNCGVWFQPRRGLYGDPNCYCRVMEQLISLGYMGVHNTEHIARCAHGDRGKDLLKTFWVLVSGKSSFFICWVIVLRPWKKGGANTFLRALKRLATDMLVLSLGTNVVFNYWDKLCTATLKYLQYLIRFCCFLFFRRAAWLFFSKSLKIY